MNYLFERSHQRLDYLQQSIMEHLEDAKKKFIQESTPAVMNDLMAIKCPHQRYEILKEVGLISEDQAANFSPQGEQLTEVPIQSLKIDFRIEDADKLLKLRQILTIRRNQLTKSDLQITQN